MKAIIIGPEDEGEGLYSLVAEDGQGLCSHFCSSARFAEGDLFKNRPERKQMFDDKGITEFVWLDESGLTKDELIERNKKFASPTLKEGAQE